MATETRDTASVPRVEPENICGRTFEEFRVFDQIIAAETHYEMHRHVEHQWAWMREGTMRIDVGSEQWHVHGEHLVWIPSYTAHAMSVSVGRLVSVYAHPDFRPAGNRWEVPLVLGLDGLSAQLLLHSSDRTRTNEERGQCQQLLYRLLETAPERTDVLALPRNRRARAVAVALSEHPGDPRTLDDWARIEGTSSKTLARAFLADTGTTFARWRTRARMYAALKPLQAGESVGVVAERVGYRTSTGFINAFIAAFGTTPGRYARQEKFQHEK